MARSWFRFGRIFIPLVLLFAWAVGVGVRPGFADVSAVSGGAFGVHADEISIFGGNLPDNGPLPTVTLPAGGSATPVTSTLPGSTVQYGPATLFSSGTLSVSTSGSLGPLGIVTSSANIMNVNTSGQEVFTATNVASTCSASEAGTTGSTVITGGTLIVSEGNPDVEGDETIIDIPTSPEPNTERTGAIEGVGDTFRFVFNEQATAADGSITVTAAHLYLHGPTALGHLSIGQVKCGVTATGGPTTTTTTGSSTTSTTGSSTTTTAATTTTAPTGTVGGGAFGFFSNVGLFGGAPATRGPEPNVALPPSGSATPLTDTAPSGLAQYGPAIIFSSGPMEVSTEGVPGGTVISAASVTNVNTSGQEVFTASEVASTCTASRAEGGNGATTITNGRLQTSEGDPDVEGDEVFVDIPAAPEPNTAHNGTIEAVGDNFRYVFNEQIEGADGSITVNAAHLYLLGPTAVGDLIIGQSKCALSSTSTTPSTSTTSTTARGGGGGGGGTSGGGVAGLLARTGSPDWLVALGLNLVVAGLIVVVLGRRILINGAPISRPPRAQAVLRLLSRRRTR